MIKTKIIRYIFKAPLISLIGSLLVASVLSLGLSKFSQRHDVRIWFKPNDQNLLRLDDFEIKFGNDESVIVAIENKNGIFNLETLRLINELTEKTWLIDQIIRVDSLSNFIITESSDDEISSKEFLPEVLNNNNIKSLKETALTHRQLPGYLINKAADIAIIYARIKPSYNAPTDYSSLVRDFEKMLKPYEKKGDIELYLTGQPSLIEEFRQVAGQDVVRIFPLLVLIIILGLFIVFKRLLAVIYPLLIIIVSISSSLGLMFWLGFKFNSLSSVIPGVITAICIADGIHIISSYRHEVRNGKGSVRAIYKSLYENFTPTFLTSFSTTIGFVSLYFTKLVPVSQMGLVVGIGCMFAWYFTFFLLGPILILFPINFRKPLYGISKVSIFSTRSVTRIINSNCKSILILTSILCGLSIYYSLGVKINANPYDYFKEDNYFVKVNNIIKNKFGGLAGPELLIDSGVNDGVKDPLFLNKVEELSEWLIEKKEVTKVLSILDIIKETNVSLNGGRDEYYKIPQNRKLIAEEIFLYQMGLPQGQDLNNRISLDNRFLRLSVMWKVEDTKRSNELYKMIQEKAKSLGLNAEVTGKISIMQMMSSYVVSTFVVSSIFTFIFIALIMAITFKSIKLGFLSLIPNTLPLIFGGGALYFLDIPLNFGTSLVFSVCLGIAVDDTIHFLSAYKEYRDMNINILTSIEKTLSKVGKALIYTTVVLIFGFGIFIFGGFIPNVYFGIICAIILFFALVLDLVFLPALLLILKI